VFSLGEIDYAVV